MHRMLRSRMLKTGVACAVVLGLGIALTLRGEAGTQQQTVPTAPPPTSTAAPTNVPSRTPTRPPQSTAVATQTSQPGATQTAAVTASHTEAAGSATETLTPTPWSTSTQTGLPGTETIIYKMEGMLTAQAGLPGTETVIYMVKGTPGTSGVLAYLLGFGLGTLILIGIVWAIRARRKKV